MPRAKESDTTWPGEGNEGQTLEHTAGTDGRTTPYHPTRLYGTHHVSIKVIGNVTTAVGLCIRGMFITIMLVNHRTRTGRTEY